MAWSVTTSFTVTSLEGRTEDLWALPDAILHAALRQDAGSASQVHAAWTAALMLMHFGAVTKEYPCTFGINISGDSPHATAGMNSVMVWRRQ